MAQSVKILSIDHLTHDVLKLVAERPKDLNYKPGQAVDISLQKQGWEEELRAFTFTSLPNDKNIEFTIKTYPARGGVTQQLLSASQGDEIVLHDVFGDISYKGEGIFIAGGAGVTPFISILNDLEKDKIVGNNKLIFANKTKADIIQEEKFRKLLGKNFINVLSDEKLDGYENGFVTAELIKKYTDEGTRYYYLCGPPPMMKAVEKQLESLGISEEHIVKEAF